MGFQDVPPDVFYDRKTQTAVVRLPRLTADRLALLLGRNAWTDDLHQLRVALDKALVGDPQSVNMHTEFRKASARNASFRVKANAAMAQLLMDDNDTEES